MGLESATYISGLVDTNPAGSDNISQGDDHLKLIKAVLKTTMPNANAVINGIHSGAVAPTSTTNGLLWFDEGNDILKLYDGGWINLLYTDGSSPPIGGAGVLAVTHKTDSSSNRPATDDTYENTGMTVAPSKISATSDLYVQFDCYVNMSVAWATVSGGVATISGYLGANDGDPATMITGTASSVMLMYEDMGGTSGTWDAGTYFSNAYKVTAANCPAGSGSTGTQTFNFVNKLSDRSEMTQVLAATWTVWEVEA